MNKNQKKLMLYDIEEFNNNESIHIHLSGSTRKSIKRKLHNLQVFEQPIKMSKDYTDHIVDIIAIALFKYQGRKCLCGLQLISNVTIGWWTLKEVSYEFEKPKF